MQEFLPITPAEVLSRGWQQLDFLFISGDAYVDHPSFGPAIICRVLEAQGYKVAILPQPKWDDPLVFTQFGTPRLGVLISGGNLDSMLCHYSAARKARSVDNYTPGGLVGARPDHATVVYARKAREIWPDVPIIIGGIEASLRRFTHYDYWEDKLLKSILLESRADLLVYGMGEKQIVEIADYLAGGASLTDLRYVPGTCFVTDDLSVVTDPIVLPRHEEMLQDKGSFARGFKLQSLEADPFRGRPVAQQCGKVFVVQNPPPLPLTEKEMDAIYDLPYTRRCHPSYQKAGGVPALTEVEFSIISHRGCFGSCNFCAIHAHQGRIIQARSHASILREAKLLTKLPNFKGYIHDVGGPTANFRHVSCAKQLTCGTCADRQCLFPEPCPNLNTDHSDYIKLLKEIRQLPGVKKVFIRSGIRYDYLLLEESGEFLKELTQHHVSGQLKIAPEHIVPHVLKLMGKPRKEVYLKFLRAFAGATKEAGLEQYVVPYFISSHPGCTLQDAVALAEFLRDTGRHPQQVQDFIPTPGSASTAMYYSGINPFTGEKVHVTRSPHLKAMQRALLQYSLPQNRKLVLEALTLAGRTELIGMGNNCLIRSHRKSTDKFRKENSHIKTKVGHKGGHT